MSKYVVYDAKKISKILKNNGYKLSRHNGSHKIYHNDDGICIVIPQSCNPMVCRRLIKENNLKIN